MDLLSVCSTKSNCELKQKEIDAIDCAIDLFDTALVLGGRRAIAISNAKSTLDLN